jgi:hypothetical protein
LHLIRGNLWQSKTYDLDLTFVKACTNLLSLMGNEITKHGYRILTFGKCTTIMRGELAVTGGPESSRDWMGIGWDLFCSV